MLNGRGVCEERTKTWGGGWELVVGTFMTTEVSLPDEPLIMHTPTGAKPALGPNCMIPYININIFFLYGIIQFRPKTG